MTPRARLLQVYRQELRFQTARPLTWILVLILALTSWGLSSGDMRISSGSSQVGGTKVFITSEFANGQMLSLVIFLFYSFFLAIAAGMAVMQDEESKVGEILHSTPLRPREYIWGKFAAILTTFLGVLGLHLLLAMFCNHVIPNEKAMEARGPFGLLNYLRPALVLGLPSMIFMTGASFAIGERSRRPIVVFVLPVAAITFCGFFLWQWSPSWLDLGLNRILMAIDPAGVRWLSETWLKVDRGAEFYNTHTIPFDLPFLLSRLAFAAAGLAAIFLSGRRFERSVRGEQASARQRARRALAPAAAAGTAGALPNASPNPSVAGIGMRVRPPSLTRGLAAVIRFELRELLHQPGLYLFIPIILIQTLGQALLLIGAFDTPMLVTPGAFVQRTYNSLTLLICLLSLFYMVESLRRERGTGIAALYYATPASTGSILYGKLVANSVVALAVVLATSLGGVIALLVQGRVGLDLFPFVAIYGFLLVPTFLLWNGFVLASYALSMNRYITYGIGLAALSLTGYLQMTNRMTWAGNWDLWSVIQWSDMSVFELDRPALLWSRLAAVGGSVFFTAFAIRFFARHDRDATRTVHRTRGAVLLRGGVRLLPYAALPAAGVVALVVLVHGGFQSKAQEKLAKDYWKQNLATWKDAPLPGIRRADVRLDLSPERRSFRTEGTFVLVNTHDFPLRKVAFTGGRHWKDVMWTLNGDSVEPENRSRLYVFSPPVPMRPGDSLSLGFSFRGSYPDGSTKNGGGSPEFILNGGIVLTSFRPTFVPIPGYVEEIGVDDKNRYEGREYPDDYYTETLRPALGAGSPFETRITVTAPAAYTVNSVGTLVQEEVGNGRRTTVWVSDYPVRFFNVVAGRWARAGDDSVAVFHHQAHRANIGEITEALRAARRHYSEWFYPYPWRQLKLSEFPALAFYAQGFPTNITFSEGIGFLTKSDPKTNLAFLVTAHEAAHQWWGNLLTPGDGPGGEILSEGTSHFSTILLMEQVKGERARIEMCKRIEERYNNNRRADSERPLVRIDGTRAGDETVTYDKGGWVFWMMSNLMGREAMLAGIQSFIRQYKDGPDYPVLQDFTIALRPFAPDTTVYDQFVRQWFHEVVVPEYRLREGTRQADGDGLWRCRCVVQNVGTGTAEVEVAAVTGDRYTKDGAAVDGYHDARRTVVLGPGAETEVAFECEFEPERIVVDPDVRVLQLQRKLASLEL